MSYANQFRDTTYATAHQYLETATTTNIIHIKRDDPPREMWIPEQTVLQSASPNANQRELERRRKVEEMVKQLPIDQYIHYVSAQYEILTEEEHARCEQLPPSDLLVRLDLDEDDLDVLAAVLCVDNGNTSSRLQT